MGKPISHCSVDECAERAHGRTYCKMHYYRWLKYGFVDLVRATSVENFWAKFVRDDRTDCWVWIAVRNAAGYGQFKPIGHRQIPAHRFAYELLVGPIPPGLTIDHLCRNPPCVNPSHLEPVTGRENSLRGFSPAAVNARKTHCKRGHPFDEPNTVWDKDGSRGCRECRREWKRRRRQLVLAV